MAEHPDCAVQFSSLVTRHAIQHSVVSAVGQMNASITHEPSKCNRGMHCTCGISFAQTFLFPKLLVRIQYTLAGEIPTSDTAQDRKLSSNSTLQLHCKQPDVKMVTYYSVKVLLRICSLHT
jgi:hypothetical protein